VQDTELNQVRLFYFAMINPMQTMVITTTDKLWGEAQKLGEYTQSTIDSKLDDIGFIHATSPDQTIAMLNRHFIIRDDILLLLVDVAQVHSEVRFEAPLSGGAGLFPHIYGPLNTDAVYSVAKPTKDSSGSFTESEELAKLAL
jgi:uncharacterized protein (DUF952 family)